MSVDSRQKKVLIMAGGTGGHVYPALATARELQKRGCEVQWLGTSRGIEARVVPENNIKLNLLTITGIRGKGASTLVSAPFKIIRSILEAKEIIKEFTPNVILGMGGYVSGPGGVAAKLLGIPLVIHEQNARAGTTNKLLAKIAKRVLVAFPNALPKGVCIGNPVRDDILAIEAPEQRFNDRSGPIRLLVLGGSLGAQAINKLVPEALATPELQNSFEVIHQTGPKNFDDTQSLYNSLGVSGQVLPYIEDVAEKLAWADFVVCRSGALTVAELSIAGVGAILIPFPYAIDDHQTANAEWLAGHGAGYVKQQAQLTADELKGLLQNVATDREKLLTMAKSARAAALPEATKLCADACLEVACG